MTLPADMIERFKAIVGEKYALTDPDVQAAYLHEMRDRWIGHTQLVLRPESVDEVAAILKLANETRTAIVPQGGNTGLVGGQIPHHGEIVLSLNRMTNIREIDPVSNTITVEAGVTLQRTREAAAEADRLYPQLLPSEGSCTIGGNLSTNAGGVAAIAHGIARSHVLGLEVVLADGRVLNNLNKLKKDNTGYDLKNLFIGAEGTLGIITAAVLRLVPQPRAVEVAFLGVPSAQAAVDLLGIAQGRAGSDVTSFELLTRFGMECVLQHVAGTRDPLDASHPWYVLMEISSQMSAGLRDVVEDIFETGVERGLVEDGAIAETLEQSKAFWRIREEVGEVQKKLGGSIKHDVSVPVAAIPAFIEEANAAVIAAVPGARPFPFGHVGDGNIHYNVSQPEGADKAAFMAQEDTVQDAVFGIVLKHGGSISAEHGIGIAKRDRLPKVKDPVAIELMRTLKAALDPNGILNPGKVL
ncbi:FAD-binding oxidoreductase [Pseudorhodoplanes sinuspersici]|uniref:Hydroxyacid dehydrogenase n=1 Tax=Pseudorhodoplanes sinuspersici TaxID=1235591 RepID=A0A1W6ZSV5_9HYPH|nr:FAD-binding oxidoreductase [Pseudorhodoplanes sinuspersici]ARQ00368.1 hydroxyacid dehydrogenase [Pseudorhodoplanes sinuspersici]RKE67469.1 4-phosphoerythronate dehydrogenase (FAD-dependent) [Pseudorhodoplanes sinuspersici]